MVVLPEGMFSRVVDPAQSSFGLRAGQTREIMFTITPAAGWYNHFGKVLGHGDLALADFVNIITALAEIREEYDTETGPFVVTPFRGEEHMHRTLSPGELAEQCSFIITTETIHVFDLLTAPLENIFVKNNIPFTFSRRRDAYTLFGPLLFH